MACSTCGASGIVVWCSGSVLFVVMVATAVVVIMMIIIVIIRYYFSLENPVRKMLIDKFLSGCTVFCDLCVGVT